MAGLCTHNRPSGNIKWYAKLKVFTKSGRVATLEWLRFWRLRKYFQYNLVKYNANVDRDLRVFP